LEIIAPTEIQQVAGSGSLMRETCEIFFGHLDMHGYKVIDTYAREIPAFFNLPSWPEYVASQYVFIKDQPGKNSIVYNYI
jgi:hypothetical protein